MFNSHNNNIVFISVFIITFHVHVVKLKKNQYSIWENKIYTSKKKKLK